MTAGVLPAQEGIRNRHRADGAATRAHLDSRLRGSDGGVGQGARA